MEDGHKNKQFQISAVLSLPNYEKKKKKKKTRSKFITYGVAYQILNKSDTDPTVLVIVILH